MKTIQIVIGTFLLLALSASLAQAQQRTFVSGGGVDTNPCTRIAPCRTFGQALSLTSPGGEVVVLDSAGYGAFAVTQSVSIIVPPGVYAGISVFSGDGIDINAGPSDTVILQGLTITRQGGTGRGIFFNSGAILHVEACTVSGFLLSSVPGPISGGLIFAPSAAATLEVKDSTFKDNNVGIYIVGQFGTAKAAIDQVRLEGSTEGLHADAGSNVTVRDSLASGDGIGFIGRSRNGLGGAPLELNLENCLANGPLPAAADSESGAATTVRASNCTFIGGWGVGGSPAVLLSRGNNTVEPGSTLGTYSAK